MLVVTDQATVGIGGQGGFAGTGQAEEHGGLAGGGVDVGRAVHGENAVLDGEQIAHGREDALLDLAGISGAGDDDALGVEVEHDRRVAVHAVDFLAGGVAGGREDRDVRTAEVAQLVLGGMNQQLANKKRLAGALANNKDFSGVGAVGAGKGADNKDLAIRKVGGDVAIEALVGLDVDGSVLGAVPVHVLVRLGGVDDVAVLGAAAGVLAGLAHQRAGVGENALACLDCVLGKLCRGPIDVDLLRVDSKIFKYRPDHFTHSLVVLSSDTQTHGYHYALFAGTRDEKIGQSDGLKRATVYETSVKNRLACKRADQSIADILVRPAARSFGATLRRAGQMMCLIAGQRPKRHMGGVKRERLAVLVHHYRASPGVDAVKRSRAKKLLLGRKDLDLLVVVCD